MNNYVLKLLGGECMSIKYDKLFALMKEKGLTSYKIRQENIISQGALTSLRALQCQPGDIVEFVDD